MAVPRTADSLAALGLALAVLALGVGGCVPTHFERPEFALLEVELKDARLTQQHFRVRLRVTNPNELVLPVRAIQCSLELGGQHFGDGQSAAAFTVPRRGSAEFDVLLTTDLASVLGRILPRLKDSTQPLEYRLAGRVDTELAFARSIPFDQRGTLR